MRRIFFFLLLENYSNYYRIFYANINCKLINENFCIFICLLFFILIRFSNCLEVLYRIKLYWKLYNILISLLNFSIYIFLLCFPYIFLYHPMLTVYFHEFSITKRISIFLIESNLLFSTNGYYFCHVHYRSWSQLKYVHYCAKVRNYLSLWTNEFFVGVREMYTYVANETVCRIVMDLHMICIYSNVQRFIFIAFTSRFHAIFSIAFEIVSSYVHAIPIASVYPIFLHARFSIYIDLPLSLSQCS